MTKYFRIFNLKQAHFFIKNGLPVLEIGVHNGRVYHKFLRDEKANKVFAEWCKNRP